MYVGFSLESPHWGVSNEYLQYVFLKKWEKNEVVLSRATYTHQNIVLIRVNTDYTFWWVKAVPKNA